MAGTVRRVFIPGELEAQIDSLRGETSFDTWLALAISEKVYGSRFIAAGQPTMGSFVEEPEQDLWVAMVQVDDAEGFLLWRYMSPQGIAMMPVFVLEEEGIATWAEHFGMELNAMNGPPIAWRHFTGGEFVEWLRAPAVEDPA